VNPVSVPTPLIIMHETANASLSVSGNGKIIILGGPQRSIPGKFKEHNCSQRWNCEPLTRRA
jgi:hypothetical protein